MKNNKLDLVISGFLYWPRQMKWIESTSFMRVTNNSPGYSKIDNTF